MQFENIVIGNEERRYAFNICLSNVSCGGEKYNDNMLLYFFPSS
jgi:hypothetical protein